MEAGYESKEINPSGYRYIREELSYIISTIPVEFHEEEVTEYLDLVEENVNGEFKAGRLKGEKYKLTLGKSGGYIDIHSY